MIHNHNDHHPSHHVGDELHGEDGVQPEPGHCAQVWGELCEDRTGETETRLSGGGQGEETKVISTQC